MRRKKKYDTQKRNPRGSEMRGGWADLGLVGLVRYLLGWQSGRSWAGLLELWSGATKYPNRLDAN